MYVVATQYSPLTSTITLCCLSAFATLPSIFYLTKFNLAVNIPSRVFYYRNSFVQLKNDDFRDRYYFLPKILKY